MTTCNPYWRTSSFSMYRYVPSVVAAVIFCILFLIAAILHAWQMWRAKAYFLGAMVAGCFTMFIGYAARAASASQEAGCWSIMPYIIQSVFILLSPALFSASVYVILGRIVHVTDGHNHVVINSQRITKTFVTGDIICLLMQCAAGGLMGGARTIPILSKIGNIVIIISLIIQLLWFGFFMVVSFMFNRAMNQAPTAAALRPEVRWKNYLTTLYVVSLLVMVRSLFRAIEFIEGTDGYLQTTEVFFYIFDATLMYCAVTYLHWKHPGEIAALERGEEPCTNGLKLLSLPSKPVFSKASSQSV